MFHAARYIGRDGREERDCDHERGASSRFARTDVSGHTGTMPGGNMHSFDSLPGEAGNRVHDMSRYVARTLDDTITGEVERVCDHSDCEGSKDSDFVRDSSLP